MSDSMLALKFASSLAVTLRADDLVANAALIDEVIKRVMIEGVHYGTIPGTPKPTLLKPGAEALGVVFRIAPSFKTLDLSTDGNVRYQSTAIGTHQTTGIILGEGQGECSSEEAKYRWRVPVCREEYEAFAENRRRQKWQKGNPPYILHQVMTDYQDQRNTVLKMANKRAHIAMIINVTGAGHKFTQDMEDNDGPRGGDEDPEGQGMRSAGGKQSATGKAPQAMPTQTGKITAQQKAVIIAACDKSGVPERAVCLKFNVETLDDLPFSSLNMAISFAKTV